MRILLTSHVFLPDYSSGTEILTYSTAKELQRTGHEVEICTGYMSKVGVTDSQRFDSYTYEGIKVNRFFHSAEPMGGQSNIVEAEYNNLLFANWAKDYLAKFKPDIVHFFHLGLLSASIIDVCYESQVPMVMTPTDFWLICPNGQLRLPDDAFCAGPDTNSINCIKHAVANNQPAFVSKVFQRIPDWMVSLLLGLLKRGMFSRAWFSSMVVALSERADFLKRRMNMLDKMIVPTKFMEEILVKNGLQAGKVIYSQFGTQLAKPFAHEPDPMGRLRIGFIGGLSAHKGAHLLISAIRQLPAEDGLILKIYGRSDHDPDYLHYLLELAAKDQRIHFCGTFPNEDIGKIFSEIDVLVVPSIWYENTPLVIYSAQTANCPVIASNVRGTSEVIEHEKNGLLFKVGDSEGLSSAIQRLLADRNLLNHLAENAIRPKPIAIYVEELLLVYQEVITDKGSKCYPLERKVHDD